MNPKCRDSAVNLSYVIEPTHWPVSFLRNKQVIVFNKSFAVKRMRRFITVPNSHPTPQLSIRAILKYICLSLTSGPLTSAFPRNILQAFVIYHTCFTCHAHHILDLITQYLVKSTKHDAHVTSYISGSTTHGV